MTDIHPPSEASQRARFVWDLRPKWSTRPARRMAGCLAAVAALLAGGGLSGTEALRVAAMDFVLPESLGSRDANVVDFSRDVQTRLLGESEYAWIERQEFERIQREVDLAGLAQVNTVSAVRLGHWLRADLLLRGEITRPAPGRGELTIEVIDLKRAELLVTSKVPVTVNARDLVQPEPVDTERAVAAAVAALAEARAVMARNAAARVVAPLYFRNIGRTGRLDFLEARLNEGIAGEAAGRSDTRILRFVRARESSDESELVLAGLTDTDPEAWRRLADTYVWGTFMEKGGDGLAFDVVPVEIRVQAWAGSGEPVAVNWDGPVRDLDKGVKSVSDRVLEFVRTHAAAHSNNESVQRIAKQLADRTREVSAQVQQHSLAAGRGNDSDFLRSREGRNLMAYHYRLLEIACFFNPLDQRLQRERVHSSSEPQNPFTFADQVRWRWLRVADMEAYFRRFGGNPAVSPSMELSERRDLTSELESIHYLLSLPPWTREKEGIHVTPAERIRQLRSCALLWAREVAAANRLYPGPANAAQLADCNRSWLYQLKEFVEDPMVARAVLEQVWPALKQEAGKELHEEADSELPARIIAIYGAFGDYPKAQALLDEAWNAGSKGAPAAVPARPADPAPRPEKPWVMPPVRPAAGIPDLDAAVCELDPWPAAIYSSPDWRRLRKERWSRVTSLAWRQGELWIGQWVSQYMKQDALPFTSRNFLWRYAPATQAIELETAKLGAHSAVRATTVDATGVWLGMDSEGVWQLPADAGEVRRFKAEDGLPSQRIVAATRDDGTLYFLGLAQQGGVLAYRRVDTPEWFTVNVPMQVFRQEDSWLLAITPQLAVSGNWIGITTPVPKAYNTIDRKWSALPVPAVPSRTDGAGTVPPPELITFMQLLPQNRRTACYTLTGDEAGFWLGYENLLIFFDPRTPDTKRLIPLIGTPTAAAHDGPRLWLVLETREGDFKLAQIDKAAGQCVGLIDLPVAALHLQVGDQNVDERRIAPADMHFTKMAVGAGRIWVGGPVVFEIGLRRGLATVTPAPGGAAPFPLQEAAARHDLPAVLSALAAKADPNEATAAGWTPLMTAVDAGDEPIVTALLQAGAKPNVLSRDGRSPLELAAGAGDEKLTRVLLRAGADPSLSAGASIRQITPRWRPVELTPNLEASAPPAEPTNLQARFTKDGGMALTWDDRSDNESVFVVFRMGGRKHSGYRLADLPANTQSYVDETPPQGPEVGYAVVALNGATDLHRFPELQPIWVQVPSQPVSDRIFNAESLSKALPPMVDSQMPLQAAAGNGHLPVVKALLAAGAAVDAQDAQGQTALLLAVREGHYEVARTLLNAGARPDVPEASGCTAAQAIYERHDDEALWREALTALPPDQRVRETSRLVLLAAADGQLADLETLRSLGAQLDAATYYGESALTNAVGRGQSGAVTWLLQHGFSLTRRIWNPLDVTTHLPYVADAVVRNGRPEMMTVLLEAGLPVDQWDSSRLPLVAAAAKANNPELVALLIKRGANLNLKSDGDQLPASYAATPEVQVLFNPAAKGGWKMPQGVYPLTGWPVDQGNNGTEAHKASNARLFAACEQGDVNGAVEALAAGAELDVCQDRILMTPLTYAAKAGVLPLVRLLVEHGAGVNVLTGEHQNSPLKFAMEAGHEEVARYLLRAGADPDGFGYLGTPPLVAAVRQGSRAMVEMLLDAGAEPDFRWLGGSSALEMALSLGRPELVDLLLARGANPQAQGFYFVAGSDEHRELGPSLLMYAAKGGNLELIRQMIALGQDPKFTSGKGYDALAWAARAGQETAVEYLLPMVKSSPHALESARRSANKRVVERLLRAGYN